MFKTQNCVFKQKHKCASLVCPLWAPVASETGSDQNFHRVLMSSSSEITLLNKYYF